MVQHTMKNPNKLCDKPTIPLEDAIKASISKGKLVAAGYSTETNVSNLIPSVPTFVNPLWIETIIIAKIFILVCNFIQATETD